MSVRNDFQVRNDLPAWRLRQLRPYGHATPYPAVGQNPEERARRSALHFVFVQARSLLAALCHVPMAFCAMLSEKLAPRDHRSGIIFEGIAPSAVLLGRLRDFGIDRSVALHRG